MAPKRPAPVGVAVDGDKLATLLARVPASPATTDYEELVTSLQGIVDEYQQLKIITKTSIAAGSLDNLPGVVLMFRLDHKLNHSDYVFSSNKQDAEVEISSWLLPAIQSLNSDFWRVQSAEVLCRTPIDLLINERLGRLQSKASFMNLAFMAEKPITADVPGGREFVSGAMDYVVGYGRSKSFTSSLVVVEAKRRQSFGGGMAQRLRQKREALYPTRMATKVYGIVSDGSAYVFLRLDGKRLEVSLTYHMVTDSEVRKTINMLDDVLESALTSTPHTTPNKSFPANSAALHAEDDVRFRLHPTPFQGMLCIPPSEYIVKVIKDDGEEESDSEVDYYDILATTPTRNFPQV